jgi:hypothetical protein
MSIKKEIQLEIAHVLFIDPRFQELVVSPTPNNTKR